MTLGHRVVLPLLGLLGLAILGWRADTHAVRVAVLEVGWGIALVVGQEVVAHLLNTLGWRFAFAREHVASLPFGELLRLRLAGDAINYLTPSATIAGEYARVAMLGDRLAADVRAASVVVAKSAQTLAQAVFMAAGLSLLGAGFVIAGPRRSPALWGLGLGLLLAILLIYGSTAARLGPVRAFLRNAARRLAEFLRDHPGRVGLSTFMFVLAYGWGSFEAYWICRFLGIPVPVFTALAIEVLSVTVDGILFMVPAKIGTQEGGKVAVFAALGLPASLGLAFGLVRHVRELSWAGIGMLLYALSARRRRWPPHDPVRPIETGSVLSS
jgi:glycosyltransferase 2 family protein